MYVQWQLRDAVSTDYDPLGDLMFDAIHNGPSQYSKAQSKAWLDAPKQGSAWAERMSQKQVILAEADGQPAGFMTLEEGGYIDFAYIKPEAQGKGLFRTLFDEVARRAQANGERQLSTHASLMAQPAFAAMGFQIDHHETVEKDGEQLARAQMSKRL